MIQFKPLKDINDTIETDEDFSESEYAGCDELLSVEKWKDLIFATTDDNEEVSELYYFLEANGNQLKHDGTLLLIAFDDVKYVLIDLHSDFIVATHKSNKTTAEEIM